MGNFSKDPLDELLSDQSKGYIGLHVEQGVPVLDRDLNLLSDLVSSTVRAIVTRYIGDGVAAGSDGFEVEAIPGDNDFNIASGAAGLGSSLVGGIEVTIDSDTTYAAQPGVTPLTTPDGTQPDPREDIVFLDVWLEEVDGADDADLLNGDDVGMQTSVRQRPTWLVRVAEGIPVPDPDPGHSHYALTRLTRPRGDDEIRQEMISDLRQTRLNLAEVERRLSLLESLTLVPTFDPSPNQFVPPIGAAGTEVRLFGRNFNVGTVRVFFGSVEATIVDPPTATEIRVEVPTGVVGPVNITVTTDGGTAVSDDTFNVLPPVGGDPPQFDPSPNQFVPPIGAPTTLVRLFGSNFDGPGLQVAFGGVDATIDAFTATEIRVFVPSGPTGAVTISVTTDFGTVTSDDTFTVT